MRALQLHAVRRTYGDVIALDGVDLSLEPGEHLALLGPSGSGKSTLLRLVAGLDAPDAGDITFDGRSQLGLPAHRRDAALVFQQYALYPHLTARGNITMGLRHGLGLPAAEADRRAEEVARQLGIDALLDRKPRAMSGGQRQRVALGRALARRAGIVLLDEPLSGLDAQLRLTLRVEIARHLREAATTTLHVTHDQADAMTSADRIAVIDRGRLQQVGTPEELYERPASLFVARFLGTPPMNTFPLTTGPDGHPRSAFGPHDADPTAVIGLRPEDLALDPTAPWTTEAVVQAVEHAGPERIVHATVDGLPVAVRTSGAMPGPGDVVPLGADPRRAHLFAGVDGQRVGSALTHAPLRHPAPHAV